MTPWPEPEVNARPAQPGEIPTTAARLAGVALAAGWDVVIHYARGTAPDQRGEPGEVVESIVLRAYRNHLGVVGTWWDGRFRTGWLIAPGTGPIALGARALRKVVGA